MKKITAIMSIALGYSSAMIKVMSPKSLVDKFDDGIIKASYANFGYIPYGHTMMGHIHYHPKLDDHTLC